MTVWIGSDLHLNHKNILKYCPARREGKPFPEHESEINDMVSKMNETIIRNWNSVVKPEDTTWILGDVAMGMIDRAPDLIRRLNGKKELVAGNHDKTLTRRIRDRVDGFTDLFESVHSYYELSHALPGEKKKMLVLSHFPISHWNSMNQGTFCLHGHLHGSPSGLTGRIKDVGIDTNDLKPYKLDDIIKELMKIDVIRDHHDND